MQVVITKWLSRKVGRSGEMFMRPEFGLRFNPLVESENNLSDRNSDRTKVFIGWYCTVRRAVLLSCEHRMTDAVRCSFR